MFIFKFLLISSEMSGSSKIFVKNRALGYVSNNIPVVVRYIQRRKECVMVTCVGRHFHTYGSAHFTLLNVSGAHPEDITSLAADRFLIHTAAGNTVYSWRMGTQIKHVFNGHTSPVHLLLPFGAHLLSVDESSTLKMWDVKAGDLYTELEFDVKSFRITTLLHPNTYINKILFGSEQGQLQLWNLHTRKLIFTFPGWKSAVTALEQAPAVDVVAIGLADGRIFLHNLRLNKSIVDFSQDWGCVTAITFRTDGPPIMVSGTGAGHVLLWDLEKREPVGQMWNAHYAAVTGLKCLPSDPLLISSSPDNSLKMWIFDMPDGTGRLLKIREGHSLPPTTFIKVSHPYTCSTVTETKNHSYGRAVFNKKMFKKVKNKRSPDAPLLMPPVVSLAYETARSKEWDDMAALHRGLAEVTTWSSDKGCMGSHKLLHSRPSLEEQNKSPGVSTLMAGYNKLTRMLMANNPDDDETIVMLKGMGPSALDVEVLSLAPEGGGSVEAMRRFLGLLCKMLVVKKDFELSQSYLALFLKHHATLVMTEPVLVSALRVLQPCQLEAWKSLEYRLTYCMSVVQAFRQL
ncbi:hypothetical protein B566_EDAN005017 [Ephemera danica]|nr:hypothetical protein B566_EDAN005017 [Ephemera danica]